MQLVFIVYYITEYKDTQNSALCTNLNSCLTKRQSHTPVISVQLNLVSQETLTHSLTYMYTYTYTHKPVSEAVSL